MGTENPWFSEGSLLALGNTTGPHPPLPLLWEPWGDQGGRASRPSYQMDWVLALVTKASEKFSEPKFPICKMEWQQNSSSRVV